MKVVVLGAGAVGGFFGGKLAACGFDVTFLVRKRRYEQLQNTGLHIKSIKGDFSIKPSLAVDANDIDQPKLVLVSLKNYHIEAALPELEKLVQKGAIILPLLNGMKHLKVLTERLGAENVLGGLCYIESTLNENGEIIHTSALHDVAFGAISDIDNSFLQDIKAMFEKAEVPVTLSETILEDMWKKYIFLTSLSGITTATRKPIGVALEDPVTFQFLKDLVSEVYTTAQTHTSNLPETTVDQVISKLQSLSPTMTSSMHRDLEKGLPIELESLHGYFIQLAEEANIETPSIRAIYSLLHPYEQGEN
ncbi:ketopantoate reductase family protein [Halalkalibacter akibai]|uniref:2-dehydropantoate 2-reductase n=1 Tax=Halalkalibacter akibai (strain ATCC 43226 / DSM 21942 / CIP 109018 / JCM 9157 / 1139) TaxID=1236973 RepID=W4QY30_HALA3|nr:ketopantoate reductase family protein [Halalkalibacter akibai]GAE36986.1 2-dehydropantoate 2-reductase [Halalkalibacter akibai JCM 9157]